jgi:membrane fusion protein, multidrug efflux system
MNEIAETSMPNDQENSSNETSSRGRGLMIAVIVLMVLGAGAYGVWSHYRDNISTDDAQVDGHITPISAKIPGNITEVMVKDNQAVKAGDVLVRIDPRDYQARVNIAKADLARAESQLRAARVVVPYTDAATASGSASANAGLADTQAEMERARLALDQTSTSDLAVAQANVQTRQAAADRARADLARMKPLADKAEISQLQYDGYLAASRVADSELEAAQQRLASAQKDSGIRKAALDAAQTRVRQATAGVDASVANRKQVDIRAAEVAVAEAAVATAHANVAAAELQLSYVAVLAPVDGVVTRKSVEVGQVVAPGQSLMTVVPLHESWVTANFKETQLEDVRVGQRAVIHVDMYGKDVEGKVDSIAGATGARLSLLPPENATGNYVKVVQRIPVKILVEKTEGLVLRPGMNVDATIYVK